MEHPTDNQLARAYLRQFNRLSIYLSLTVFIFFIISREDAFFGLNQGYSLNKLLAFDVTNPWRFYGLTCLSSFFVHATSRHLISNIVWLAALGFWLEKKIGLKKLFWLLISGHMCGLIVSYMYLAGQAGLDDRRFVLGSSAAILSLIGFAVWQVRHFIAYAFGVLLFIVICRPIFITNAPSVSILNHLIPYLWGIVWGYWFKSKF